MYLSVEIIIKEEQLCEQNNKRHHLEISGKMSLSDIIQVCEISSIFWFCDAFSTHIKSFSHSASLGSSCSVPLWVAGTVCLLHMKEMGLSCLLQMFIHRGTASEKVQERLLSLRLAVWKLIDLFGFGKIARVTYLVQSNQQLCGFKFHVCSQLWQAQLSSEKSGWI